MAWFIVTKSVENGRCRISGFRSNVSQYRIDQQLAQPHVKEFVEVRAKNLTAAKKASGLTCSRRKKRK